MFLPIDRPRNQPALVQTLVVELAIEAGSRIPGAANQAKRLSAKLRRIQLPGNALSHAISPAAQAPDSQSGMAKPNFY